MSSLTQTNPESWEQHETQIRLERADEFTKLSPAEQQKVLVEEKNKFEKAQQEAKDSLGFRAFNPEEAKEAQKHGQSELQEQQKELAKFEQSLHKSSVDKSLKPQKKDKEVPFDQKRFFDLFKAAAENIQGQKPFDFQSVDLDDFGNRSSHIARMTGLTDFSQTKNLQPSEILSRIEGKKTSPENISLRVEIDMGEDKQNDLGLTNLAFEIPLVDLMNGHFVEKISKFTNLVFFAALMHDRQIKELSDSQKTPAPEPKPVSSPSSEKLQPIGKFAALQLGENGGLQNARGVFEQGNQSTIAFSCNHGFIWGTFDQHGVPNDPKQLQEALDKIKTDK